MVYWLLNQWSIRFTTKRKVRMKVMRKAVTAVVFGMVTGLAMTVGANVPPYVEVSCDDDSVTIVVDENNKDFFVFAPGKPDSFIANITVAVTQEAKNQGWKLVAPEPNNQPIKMSGGGNTDCTYQVKQEPEGWDGGTIKYFNYYIESNITYDGSKKNITVPMGTSVTYTAFRNGAVRSSDWTVIADGEERKVENITKIIFNRDFWDMDGWWFVLSQIDTPKDGDHGRQSAKGLINQNKR